MDKKYITVNYFDETERGLTQKLRKGTTFVIKHDILDLRVQCEKWPHIVHMRIIWDIFFVQILKQKHVYFINP